MILINYKLTRITGQMNTNLLLLSALLLVIGQSLYDDNSPVLKLTEKNFKESVLMSDEFWLVEFYGIYPYI